MSIACSLISKKKIEDAENKILQISFQDKELIDFQIEMINNHKERGLIEVQKYIFNKDINLKYYVTGLESLEDYIKNSEIDKESIAKIFSNIADIILHCKELLLEGDNFILEKDCVYIDLNTMEIKLINVPLMERYSDNINESYMNLIWDVVRTILLEAKIKNGDADYFVNLKNNIRDNRCSISEFVEKLSVNRNNKAVRRNESKSTVSENSQLQEKKNISRTVESRPSIVSKQTPKIDVSKNKSIEPTNQPQVKAKEMQKVIYETVEKEKFSTIRLILAVMVQPIIIGIILSLFIVDGMEVTQIAGGAMLLAALDVLVLRVILDKTKKKKVQVKVKKSVPVEYKQQVKLNEPKGKVAENKPYEPYNTSQVKDESTTLLDSDTSFLKAEPYLELRGEGIKKYIKASPFIIGRQAEFDQWIKSNSIGRRHAQIVILGDDYYLEDLNSKNGTILNEHKLGTGERVKLKDGDIITLSDLILIFKME